jgi:hypothetical protein
MSANVVPERSIVSRIHGLLAVQSVVIILLSINRLSTLTLGYVAPNEFLRWVDLNNMLILPLISMVAFYLLKKVLQQNPLADPTRWNLLLNVMFIVGIYLLAASYGDHEVTNYLHTRFCEPDNGSDLCRIVIYNDDEFSHFVFFTGFVLVNAALMFIQVIFPHPAKLSTRDKALLVVNGLFIAAGLFANLAFEEIGLDLYVVLILAALSVSLLWRRGAQPMFIYYTTAYVVGLVATVIVKLTSG